MTSTATCSTSLPRPPRRAGARWVDDVHSRTSRTRVAEVLAPASVAHLVAAVRRATATGRPLAVAGGKHAMGAQPFATGATLLDSRGLDRVLAFDREAGTVEVEAGIQWPALFDVLDGLQRGVAAAGRWAVAQKQTGADRLSLGGALAANVHGRGLRMTPIVGDVESLVLVDPAGEVRRCSRHENRDLFALAIGGYGLFGLIYAVTLRLIPLATVRREVAVLPVEAAVEHLEARAARGCDYGDFQFAVDPASPDFLRLGIASTYRRLDPGTPVPPGQRRLSSSAWRRLLLLAHRDKTRAFARYRDHYLATAGQLYRADRMQLTTYVDDYHREIDRALGCSVPGSELIAELYVPRAALGVFMAAAAEELRRRRGDVIYGTVRLIERDRETVLAWARAPWACVVFNLHAEHTPAGLAASRNAFRALIARALELGGSFYLTYTRAATRAQVAAAYPRWSELLAEKRRRDPAGVLTSDWYRHYADL